MIQIQNGFSPSRRQSQYVREKGPDPIWNHHAGRGKLKGPAKELGVDLETFQTNHEGAMCEKIHQAHQEKVDAPMPTPPTSNMP